jgi:hypothetical protein
VLALLLFSAVLWLNKRFKEPTNEELKHKIDSLISIKDSLETQIRYQEGIITVAEDKAKNKQKQDIIIIDKKYEKMADSVRVLDVDGDINFFTDYLSKNDSIR